MGTTKTQEQVSKAPSPTTVDQIKPAPELQGGPQRLRRSPALGMAQVAESVVPPAGPGDKQRAQKATALQRTLGNTRLARLFSGGGGPQAKIAVGQPNDRYEQEAEQVAGRVVSGEKVARIARIAADGLTGKVSRQPEEKPVQGAEEKESPVQTATEQKFDANHWFEVFKKEATEAFKHFGLSDKEVPINKDLQASGQGEIIVSAHYNPNKRAIYCRMKELKRAYDLKVLAKKVWSVEDFDNFVRNTALEEAFHAYQDTPRHKSKKFQALVQKTITDKVLWKMILPRIEDGTIKNYTDFRTMMVPVLTEKYDFENKIKEFAEEIPPGATDRTWRLSKEGEIRNQWLHILDDYYWRAKDIASAMAKPKRPPSEEKHEISEKRHEISLVERQAGKFAAIQGRIRTHLLKLQLLQDQLAKETEPAKQKELQQKVAVLREEADVKNIPKIKERITLLKKEIDAANLRALKLQGNASKLAAEEASKKIKECADLEDQLDILYTLKDGIEAMLRNRKLL